MAAIDKVSPAKMGLLDDGSPTHGAKKDNDAAMDSNLDGAGGNGGVEITLELAKTWKMDLEKEHDKLKWLRFRNSKWLSILCMIDPDIDGKENQM